MLCVVKPDPVAELEAVQSLITANSASLTWKSPNADETILFRISVKRLADNSDVAVSLAFVILSCIRHTFACVFCMVFVISYLLAIIS